MASVGLSAGTAFITILPNMAGFAAAVQSGVRGASASMAAAGASLTRKLTLPIVGAGVAAVNLAKNFETTFTQMQTLAGATNKQLKLYREHIRGMAGEVPQSPQELAEALQFIASSGFAGREALDVLDASAEAAAIGLGSAATVADVVTSSINAYGKENITAANTVDVLTRAVELGKAEADSFAPVLGSILPTASELGVTFEDVAASIAAMSRTGDSAATASTKVNAIFSSFIKTTAAQDKAFKAAGTSAAELRDSLAERGLLPTLLDLRDAVGGNIAKLGEMFPNVRALRGVLSLTGKQAEENVKIFEDIQESAGKVDAAFEDVSETAQFKLDAAMGEIKQAGIDIGSILLPIVGDLASGLGDLFAMFSNLSPSTQKMIVIFAGIAAAIGPVLLIASKLLLIFTPLGLAITAIGLAAGVIIKNWDKIGPVVMPILMQFKETILNIWDALRQVDWAGVLSSVLGTVTNAIVSFWNALKSAWDATANLRGIIADLASAVGRNLADAWRSIVVVWQTSIQPALKNLKDAFMILWDPVLKAVAIVVGVVLAAAFIAITKILPFVIRLIGTLIRWLTNIIKAVALVIQWVGRVIGAFARFAGSVPRMVGKTVGAILGWFAALPGKIGGFLSTVFSTVARWFGKAKDKALDIVGGILDWFKKLPGKVASAISGLPAAFGNVIRNMANAAIGWWNRLDFQINFSIPNVPGLPGRGTSISTPDLIPDIPFLARGGIVTKPTLAVIGEGGPEAVIPLSNRRGGGRTEFVITNWDRGTGYFKDVANGEIAAERRMRR